MPTLPPSGGVGGPPADLMLPNGMLPLPEELLPPAPSMPLHPNPPSMPIQPSLPIQSIQTGLPSMPIQPTNLPVHPVPPASDGGGGLKGDVK